MRGAVVAAQPIAVEEGVKVLRRGGNAVDAAVTCAFVQMVADPQMCGIGGYGYMNIFWRDSGEKCIIGFPALTPAKATETMFVPEVREGDVRGGFWGVKNYENQMGYKAVAVPGTLKGLYESMKRYGSIPWKEAITPAITIARQGIQVHEDWFHFLIKQPREGVVAAKTKFNATAECARIYLKDGDFYQPGDILLLTDHANTLETIAHEGPEVFYQGEIAQIIAENFRKNGGILAKEDLHEYRATITQALKGTYREYTLFTTPPPDGGVSLISILNILEGFDLKKLELNSPEYIHLVARAEDIAFSDRAKFWGDPAFVDIPIEKLTSKTYAEECRKAMVSGKTTPTRGQGHNEDTTHVSVVDKHGNAVALTHTLGSASGVVVPGLGFLFNNGMSRFNPRPGLPDSVAPKKKRSSPGIPTIVFRGDEPVLVLGGAGGNGILTGVLQTILNVIDHGRGILEAVSAPRFHSENNLIDIENRICGETCEQLRARGHKVRRRPYSYDEYFGNVQVIMLDWEKDRAIGGSCPRRGGMALYA
jgi:gamma-glutamyltranspeptidase/glutathione hydrolase